MAAFCMAPMCTGCVSCVLSFRGVGCLYVESSGALLRSVPSPHAQPVLQPVWHFFVRVPFEKMEHIIHRQGHMPSSRPPLLHPHNARCHAHSYQLVPVCLPMPITVGQFTFSTHNSRVLCPRCGRMQAPSGKKTVFVLFLPFWHANVWVCVYADKQIQQH